MAPITSAGWRAKPASANCRRSSSRAWRPPFSGDGAGSEILRQIGANAREDRHVRRRQLEFLPGDGLERRNIKEGGVEDNFARNFRDRIAIGVAPRGDPAPQEVLVERLGRFPCRETTLVAVAKPVAAAVGGVDFV